MVLYILSIVFSPSLETVVHTAPVVADGRLYVASLHRHTLYALDEDAGNELWTFTAEARIDSPPASCSAGSNSHR